METGNLIGKTIQSATKVKDDEGGCFLTVDFTDGSKVIIEAAHGEYDPECEDEYPDYVNIVELKKPTIKNLGWVNSWKETPEIVLECRDMKHHTDITYPSGRYKGVEKTTCRECGYFFQINSGG